MSKRYTGEEWSDDDFDDYSLSGSPPKRRKNFKDIESKESSESGFFVRTIKSIYSSVNNLLKGISLSPEEQRMNCESIRSQNSLGMNQNNNIYSLEMRSEQPLIQINHNQPYILTPDPNPRNYVLIQSSTQQSAQIVAPISVIYSNPSPNPLVVLSTSPQNDIEMNPNLKCDYCGQVSTSPISRCSHCHLVKTVNNKKRVNSSGIDTQLFYTNQTTSGVGRGTRMAMSSASMVDTPHRLACSSLTSSLSANRNGLPSNQRLNQFNRQIIRKLSSNPELIELDAENVEKTSQSIPHESNEDCIEIMDTNGTEENSGIGVQCDIDSDRNDSKIKSIDSNSNSNNSTIVDIKAKNQNNSEDESTLHSMPDYIMFGTYRTNAKNVDFSTEGIKVTNVSPNTKDTKFKYHIMIPFIEMQELFYYSDGITNLLFIKPTKESNQKIQQSMYLGTESQNGLKFDIDSTDSREHYMIDVLKDKFSERFIKILRERSLKLNSNIKFEAISEEKAKTLLQRARSRPASEPKVISSSRNSSILETTPKRNNPFATNNNNKSGYKSDSSGVSPSPKARRSTSRTPIQTIIIDIDDDEEDIIETKFESESEFEKVIFSYPEDDKNAIHVVGTDMKCLNKGEFLNDNIVNFYLRYYFNERLTEEDRQRTHIFDTLFFIQLTEKRPPKRKNSLGREEQYTFEQRYEQKLKKWTKNLDIFSKDFLVFPIIKESHWFLSIVCYPSAVSTLNQKTDSPKVKSEDTEVIVPTTEEFLPFDKKPCIIFMDSLGNGCIKKSLSTPIREFLAQEWKSKTKSELSFKTAKVMKDFSPEVPKQTNSSDCGLFVLEYVEQFLTHPDEIVKDLWDKGKDALKKWFNRDLVKTKRQDIRALVLERVSHQLKERLETLIDDSKLSDYSDDEIGMEIMNSSVGDSKSSSPEEEIL